MTDAERIQQLTTNLQASLALNNITRATAPKKVKKSTGFFAGIKNIFKK